MKVLVIGSGGREHCLIWKISQNKEVKKIYCASGNAGTMKLAENIEISPTEIDKLKTFAKKEKIDLTVVGPELPLVLGIVNEFEKEGLPIFGPNKKAALLEGSKSFARNLMKKYNIPQPQYSVFDNIESAKKNLRNFPIVIKADGLAEGKGVFIATNKKEADDALYQLMIEKKFKEAGTKIIIEEFLQGEEVSIFAFTDGKTILPMVSAQDHKRVFDNDKGLNTGGMGAYSPTPLVNSEIFKKVMDTIFKPTISALNKEGYKYKGILYAGLMICNSLPYVLEFNCRFGDPETQAILPRLKTDIVTVFEAVITENLDKIKLDWRDESCVCVILASGGYPEKYEKNIEIKGFENLDNLNDIFVFHSGTKYQNNKILTNGGRVLGVTGLGENLKTAIKNTYQAVSKIKFDKMHYRKDIGTKGLKNENK